MKTQNSKTNQESELIKPQLPESNFKKNNIIILDEKKQPLDIQNNSEIQENKNEETIFLIKKNPKNNIKLRSTDVANQVSKSDLKTQENQNNFNQNNKKIFKFKKTFTTNLDKQTIVPPINSIDKSPQTYEESDGSGQIKNPIIKKFKLKKIDNETDVQNNDSITNQEENI